MRTQIIRRHAITLALLLIVPLTAAQDAEALARDPVLFLNTARAALNWHEPAQPAKIVGPIHFVGTKGLGVWLITTSQGHILLNTGMPGSGPLIADAIRKLGFKPEDIRIMLAGHAHIDHVGGHAHLKKLSGARVATMAEEVDLLQSGGKLDFHYGANKEFAFGPVTVDQVLRDGATIKLGEVAVTALLTRGHTRGSTTFVMSAADAGKVYTVVFPDGTSVNPGYRLVKNPSYSGIADDYRRTYHTLELLKPDIWLTAHPEISDFDGKHARAAREGVAAWVDPEGYRRYVVAVREKFEATVNTELGAPVVKESAQ